MTGDADIVPLTKRRLTGEFYTRVPRVEELLAELTILERDQLIARAAISNRTDPDYIPSECLVYFIRASRNDNGEAWFERLYKLLAERLLRALPREGNCSPSGPMEPKLVIA